MKHTSTICTHCGDGIATNAPLNNPTGLAVDSLGNLYIADDGNSVVRKVSAVTGIISVVAGSSGYPSISGNGDGGPATSATMSPYCIALDNADNLSIGDNSANESVRKVSAQTGIITTVVGSWDAYDEKGDGGAATSAQINPVGLTFDSAGNLFFSNSLGAIREVNTSTGAISRVAGIGFSGFAGDGGPALAARISLPSGIAFDPAGNLIFADRGNNRIRKISFAVQTAATPTIAPVTGTYSSAQSVTISDTTPGARLDADCQSHRRGRQLQHQCSGKRHHFNRYSRAHPGHYQPFAAHCDGWRISIHTHSQRFKLLRIICHQLGLHGLDHAIRQHRPAHCADSCRIHRGRRQHQRHRSNAGARRRNFKRLEV